MNYLTSLLKELVAKRKLIWELSKADFRKRFVGSYFGVVWMFIQPIVTVLIYWLIFGPITSNVKSDKLLVKVHAEDGDIETGIKKFGAMLGDCVEIGCGSVLNPGTVIGRNCNIYPLSSVRGCVDGNSIYKKQGEIAKKVLE